MGVRELDRKSAKERAAKRAAAAEEDEKFREKKRKETLEMNEKVASMEKDRTELLREHQELQTKLGMSSHIGDMQQTMALYKGKLAAIQKNIKFIGAGGEAERRHNQLGSSVDRSHTPGKMPVVFDMRKAATVLEGAVPSAHERQ